PTALKGPGRAKTSSIRKIELPLIAVRSSTEIMASIPDSLSGLLETAGTLYIRRSVTDSSGNRVAFQFHPALERKRYPMNDMVLQPEQKNTGWRNWRGTSADFSLGVGEDDDELATVLLGNGVVHTKHISGVVTGHRGRDFISIHQRPANGWVYDYAFSAGPFGNIGSKSSGGGNATCTADNANAQN